MRLPRPVLIATATATAAAALLLTPNGAVADPTPGPGPGPEAPVREGSGPYGGLSGGAAKAPESATDRALTAPVTELTPARGPYGAIRASRSSPRTRRTLRTSPSSWASPRITPSPRS